MHPPTYRVLEVPELVRLICSFVEKPNLAQLLTVSRCFFHCAAPLVWKEVSGVMILLCLLPSLEMGDDKEVRPEASRNNLLLNASLSSRYMSSIFPVVTKVG